MDTQIADVEHLFRRLPFSVSTRKETESDINAFFEQLFDSSLVRSLIPLQFTSYSFALLDDVTTWKVRSLSNRFYFKSAEERFSNILLSFYYYYRRRLHLFASQQKKFLLDSVGMSNAEIVAYLFNDDTAFRVRVENRESWDFSYSESSHAYSFSIPEILYIRMEKGEPVNYRQHFRAFINDITSVLANGGKEVQLLVSETMVPSLYEKGMDHDKFERTAAGELHKKFYEAIFDEERIYAMCSEMSIALENYYFRHEDKFISRRHIADWIFRLPSIALFSLFHRSWTEYIPALCGHVELKGGKLYGRNLGCFIIGYRDDLSREARSLLRLISDRVSSALSTTITDDLLERMHDHALNSAITQTAARNYAHHIGAHVKMRTTPQEIKKRINDLYPALSLDL